jgi:hypothetical protein
LPYFVGHDYADPRNTTGMTTVLLDTTLTAVFAADNTIRRIGRLQHLLRRLCAGGRCALDSRPAGNDDDDVRRSRSEETVFLTNLQAVAGFKIDEVEPQLHLLNDKGQVIILLKQQ